MRHLHEQCRNRPNIINETTLLYQGISSFLMPHRCDGFAGETFSVRMQMRFPMLVTCEFQYRATQQSVLYRAGIVVSAVNAMNRHPKRNTVLRRIRFHGRAMQIVQKSLAMLRVRLIGEGMTTELEGILHRTANNI